MIRTRTWYSVNGKRIGLKIEGGKRFWMCEAIKQPVPSKAPVDCKNQPYFRRDLPSDAKAMREWLYKNALGILPPDVRARRALQSGYMSGQAEPERRLATARAPEAARQWSPHHLAAAARRSKDERVYAL